MNARRLARRLIVVAALLAPGVAAAARPTLSGPAQTYGVTGGVVLVHYTTSGVDAVPAADTDGTGVSDFVENCASVAEDAMARYAATGFRAPVSDGTLADNGGDGRTDIYLQNLQAADGNTSTEGCTGSTCIAYAVVENDYAGFGYPSQLEGIRSVVPHELFHVVQYAYSNAQPAQWNEGSAVWATELVGEDQNSDFERFLDSFLTKTFRPFERDAGGFGDLYVYGASLWPYFLEKYAGVATVVEIFDATATMPFLDAADSVVADGLDPTFAEFTRWNLFTGERAAGGLYPAEADTWPEVPLEPALTATDAEVTTTVAIEGLSARYLPLGLGPTGTWRVTVEQGSRTLRAWVVARDGAIADGVELEGDGDLTADLPPTASGDQILVVTGLSPGTLATQITVRLAPATDEPGDGGGCCSTGGGGGPSSGLLAFAVLMMLRRRR